MPRFANRVRAEDNPPVAAPWWAKTEAGEPLELVVLKPTKTFLGSIRAQLVGLAGITPSEAQSMTADDAARRVDAVAIQRAIMLDMIVRMTDESGEDVAVSAEMVENLDEDDGSYIWSEIEQRKRDIVTPQGGDFRPAVADRDAVEGISRGLGQS